MKCLIAFVFVSCVSAMQSTRMYMEKSGLSDLKSSASGYVYSSANGHPVSYVQFSSEPLQPIVHYLKPVELPAAQEYVQSEDEVAPENLELQEDVDDSSYEKGDGEEYKEQEASSRGEKGDKGYASKHDYEQGEKGHHDKENHKGYYDARGGNRNGHHDSASHHQANHQEGKGVQGANFEKSGYHKKGEKTTGFHNVYHKDEYKKDHTFYDEADKKGSFNKYGGFHKQQEAQAGGHKKGGSSDAAFEDQRYGKKGSHDKGHFEDVSKGYKGEAGADRYHNSQAEFANEAGKKASKEFGYQNGGLYHL